MIKQISQTFRELVELRYQLYNGLFMNLPLDGIQKTGAWLPLLHKTCQRGFQEKKSPEAIIGEFFRNNNLGLSEREEIDFLFRIIQYVERQIVLIDALEDSAYKQIHRVNGPESWNSLMEKANSRNISEKVLENLGDFEIRVVLTAHPTQFYPESVLAIITDLSKAIQENKTAETHNLLNQLGQTPFFQKQKPSPLNEAKMLMNYLSHVFYPAVGKLLDEISGSFPDNSKINNNLIRLGFWPGGDRDGNPFVTVDITRKIAAELKHIILNCYFEDIKKLTRRITFAGIYERLVKLKEQLRQELIGIGSYEKLELESFQNELEEIERLLRRDHQGLNLNLLSSFKRKVNSFGFFFASLDIRQDSRILHKTLSAVADTHPGLIPSELEQMDEEEQIEVLMKIDGDVDPSRISDPVLRDTVESFVVIHEIQKNNGQHGAHRYIISNCRGALDIARLFALFRLCGWKEKELTVDVVPLFETISDLEYAAKSMQKIYSSRTYRTHLKSRNDQQTVMLGFSDGTKDGGYLMANWSIYSAKESITEVSRDNGVIVHFFDGRGGPPARGGGNSHKFYSALGNSIESQQIQLTLQGQTIGSHYGIEEAAVHNIQMLLTAGLKNRLYSRKRDNLTNTQRSLIDDMARISYQSYQDFKNHPKFIPFLLERSTLKYYGMANIGSRPSKRGNDEEFRFEDLRAIPFVGAWSQLKQNVPGFYGLGTALKKMEEQGKLDDIIRLYSEAGLFRAFITNSMQSMSKTNFNITSYMKNDKEFGDFWQIIYDEYELSKEMVLKVSLQPELLEDNPRSKQSIQLREGVVLPLLTIQQYALIRIQQKKEIDKNNFLPLYEKIVMRSLFGNINATRNAV